MNNDLISRSELKKAIIKRLGIKSEEFLLASERTIYDEIDNAPTVKPEPYVIDSCDMNVFEPEKYMKERPQEEKQYTIKVNVPEDIRDKLIEELSKPRKVILDEHKTVTDCIIAYGDGFESARRLFERPHGEWVKSKEWMTGTITTIYKCSECGRTIATMPNRLDEYPFCHCGADMRKGEEE